MYVNNSSFGLKICNFVNDNVDNKSDEILKFLHSWLDDIKQFYFINDNSMFDLFLESFMYRFYSRTMNFDTTLDFKFKLISLLQINKEKYKNIYKIQLLDIDPLLNVKKETIYNENSSSEGIGKNESDVVNHSKSTDTIIDSYTKTVDTKEYDSGTNTNNQNLKSDTPKSNVNLNDIFTNNTFVSFAEQNKNINNNFGKDIDTNETTNRGQTENEIDNTNNSITNTINNLTNNRDYKIIEKSYDGNAIDLLEKFANVIFDVNKTILDDIENANLFSNYYL